MRVVHVDAGQEMRGGQWQALRLTEGMLAAGHDPVLLAPRNGPLYGKAASRGVPVRPLTLRELRSLAKSADLVHAHDARAHTAAAIASRAPVIVARRVAFPLRRGVLSRWKYARARHLIAVSQHVRARLLADGIEPAKVSVVYDGVPVPDAAMSSGDAIVAPATSDPRKGTALLREAAVRAGLDVRFSEVLEEDLKRALFFVYITQEEGLGSAVLLAMAAGVPVIASRTGGLPEIVEHCVTGLLVGNEPGAIADAMRLLGSDGILRATLAARARDMVRDRFSVAAMVHDTLEVYKRVLC